MPQIGTDDESRRQATQTYFENLLTLQAVFNQNDTERLNAIRVISRDIHEKKECYTLRNLAVNGEDLAVAGIPRGVEIGKKLEEMLDAVMRDPAKNDKSLVTSWWWDSVTLPVKFLLSEPVK